MNFDTIFFDVGNTLFFFNYEFLRDLLSQRFGVSVSAEELSEKHVAMRRSLIADGLFHLSHEELWWELYRRWLTSVGVEDDAVKAVTLAIRDHPFKHLFWSKIEDGTREMLDWFRERGFKIGIISNAEGQIKRLIEHVNLEERFDVIVDSAVVGFSKPDSRIFEHAMVSVGANPANSIHVGDLVDIDVVGARAVGITPILVDPNGLNGEADCIKVPRVIDLPKLNIFAHVR